MGVMCQILVDPTAEGVHKAGDTVSGILKYAVDEATEFKEIKITLSGVATCHWEERRNSKQTVSYHGKEKLIKNYIHVLDKKEEETATVPIGAYEYPFQFQLPKDIPSSHKDYNSCIKYLVKSKFVKTAFFSKTNKYETEICVYGNVNPTAPDGPIIYGAQKKLFKPFSVKDQVLNLKAEIAKSFVMPGENVDVRILVTNDSSEDTTVKTEIISRTIYTARCGRTHQYLQKYKECLNESPAVMKNTIASLSASVPVLPSMHSIQHCKVVDKEYKVKVTMRLPLPHIDTSVEIPIVIGERDGEGVTEKEVLELEDTDEKPPSYSEAVGEDKTKEDKASGDKTSEDKTSEDKASEDKTSEKKSLYPSISDLSL